MLIALLVVALISPSMSLFASPYNANDYMQVNLKAYDEASIEAADKDYYIIVLVVFFHYDCADSGVDPHWIVHKGIFGDGDVTIPNQWAIMQSGNLFAFCVNNPVMFHDPSGKFIKTLLIIAGAALLGGGLNAGTQLIQSGGDVSSLNVRDIAGSAAGSATFAGAVMIPGAYGVKLGLWGSIGWTGAAGGLGYTVTHTVAGTPATVQGTVNAALTSAVFAGVGFAVTTRTAPSTGNFLSSPARRNGVLNVGAGARPIDGAFNIDIRPGAKGVFRGNVADLSNIATGSQGHVIMANPHGFNPLAPEVGRVLARGGVLNITGGMSNRYFNQVFNMSRQELSRQGFHLVGRGQIANANPGLQTSGAGIMGSLYQILLQRL